MNTVMTEGQIEATRALERARVRGLERTHLATSWQPFAGDNSLSAKLKSAPAKEARRLYDEWRAAELYATRLVSDSAALPDRLREASQALDRARQREVETLGETSAIEEAKALAALEVEAKATGGNRREAAREEVARRRAALEEFVRAHWQELVEEHRAHAERINKQWLAAEAQFEQAVAGLRDQHDELTESLRSVIGNVEPFTQDDLPRGSRQASGYEQLAYPSPESVARRAAFEQARAAKERRYAEDVARRERARREAEGAVIAA